MALQVVQTRWVARTLLKTQDGKRLSARVEELRVVLLSLARELPGRGSLSDAVLLKLMPAAVVEIRSGREAQLALKAAGEDCEGDAEGGAEGGGTAGGGTADGGAEERTGEASGEAGEESSASGERRLADVPECAVVGQPIRHGLGPPSFQAAPPPPSRAHRSTPMTC